MPNKVHPDDAGLEYFKHLIILLDKLVVGKLARFTSHQLLAKNLNRTISQIFGSQRPSESLQLVSQQSMERDSSHGSQRKALHIDDTEAFQ